MELFDLYTKDRQPTGLTMKRGEAEPAGCYRMVVQICIFNSRGELLIQQRQKTKDSWANMWDISAGGCAVAGEDSSTAAERETFEELGIRISFKDIAPALTVHWSHGFNDIYTVIKDVSLGELRLQPEEVQDARWATLDEILKMVGDGVFMPYKRSMLELFFELRLRRGNLTV